MNSEKRMFLGETARRLGVCEDTVRRLADTGELPCEKAGGRFRMFTVEDVERFARAREAKRKAKR